MSEFRTKLNDLLALVLLLIPSNNARADWPTLRGNTQRTGFVAEPVKGPFRLAWARSFQYERLGTAMEPIATEGKVFVATHSGNLFALDAADGRALWRFHAQGAFLQSPAVASGVVVAGCEDGSLYALRPNDGTLAWSFSAAFGGFSASPTVVDKTIFIGARDGTFFAVDLATGKIIWERVFNAPIRQTAAFAHGSVFITTEDLRVHCLDAGSGKEVWISEPLTGQTARDYYPIVVETNGRTRVIVRTNPILSMGNHIGRDRHVLCQNAGVDESGWQKIDAWTKSEQARGNPELWAKEQSAIVNYLSEHRAARTFFVLDAQTGKETDIAPVLWIAGCQGVGAEPALTADGRLLVFHRSAYGNWNHGVAPLVALGLLDLKDNRISPLFHQFGMRPAWNTFWGTADESQNFTIAGDTVLIVHQGTLSSFNLKTQQLAALWGERDTYGGFRSPAWARNEWHGPGRGSVAISDNRIYWLTGSRVLCLAPGDKNKSALETVVEASNVPAHEAPSPLQPTRNELSERLAQSVRETLWKPWAPLFVEPGLSGRDFSFDDSGALFEALAWAYPHLPGALKSEVKNALAKEWETHPPFTKAAWYSLKEGERREWFWTPEEVRTRLGQDKPPHPFGNMQAVWVYAERCDEWPRVLQAWPALKESFDDFVKTNWRLDAAKGDIYANRYLASLLALAQIAAKAGDRETATQASKMAAENSDALVAWWKRAAQGTLTTFKGSQELDPFIGKGDGLSFRVAPHRHKLALFQDLTPEVAGLIKDKAPEAVAAVWKIFAQLYATWPLSGEERQVHFGENFVDPPDLALGGFKALAWLQAASKVELARRVDLPFCRADLDYVTKLALALEDSGADH